MSDLTVQFDGTPVNVFLGENTALAGQYATLAAAWAEGTLPGGAGTKSAKEHAADAEGFAAATGGFPPGFPLAKLVEAYYFDEVAGSTVRGVNAGLDIDLNAPTTPGFTVTGRSVRLAAGLIQTPSITGCRSQTILYRCDRGGTAGYLISGGTSSGSGTNQQGVTVAETHRVAGFGLSPFQPAYRADNGTACNALNRGGWLVYNRQDTAARNSIYGLGGRHSTTTARCADFEINCAFFWNDVLTDAELASVYLYIRQRAAKRGIYLHREDAPQAADLYMIVGESNADGRSTITDLSAADRALAMRHTLIAASTGGTGLRELDEFELGFNQQASNPATQFGPEFGVAAQRRASYLVTKGIPAVVAKCGLGGTRLAPSSTGIAAGTTWNPAELPSGGLFYFAIRHLHETLQEVVGRGIGFKQTVRVGLWIGLNDATSTTYASSSAVYQGYLQAFWDAFKAQFPGLTLNLIVFRPHTADPASNVTAIANVRAGIADFDTANADVSVVDTDALGLQVDSVHYNAAASRSMGVTLHG